MALCWRCWMRCWDEQASPDEPSDSRVVGWAVARRAAESAPLATDSAVGVPVRRLATEATKEGRKTMSNETEKLIEEAERLSKCASPGPWRRGSVHSAEEVWAAYPESIAGLAGERLLLRLNPEFTSEADTAFIARARTLVPDLVTALRAERERAEKAEEELGEVSALIDSGNADLDALEQTLKTLTAERDRYAAANIAANKRIVELEHERDEARSKLSRLTTPRPIAEAPTDKPVIGIWLDHQGKMCVEVLRFDGRWLGAPGTPIYREAEFLPLPVLP